MDRILVATDFSTRSDRALLRATLIARTTGASLTLAHVVDADQPAKLIDADTREVTELLDELAETLRAEDGVAR